MPEEKKLIPLTGEAPASITPSRWPVIARANWWDSEHRSQANTMHHLAVRQHADGRTIVYGSVEAGPGGQYGGFEPTHGGELLPPGADLAAALGRVAREVGVRPHLLRDALAELPPRDLDREFDLPALRERHRHLVLDLVQMEWMLGEASAAGAGQGADAPRNEEDLANHETGGD